MSRYQPPRRESIEDHLRVARARVRLSGAGWTDKLASPSWVEDLIREDIISGPYRVRKTEGRGLGQRLAPRDYRDLLQIIDLKSQGVNRRSAWVAHLWLAGREYPITHVRAAFRAEIRKIVRSVLRDFAPRERLRTQPFGKRYDRRVRQRQEDSIFPELVDIIEPIAALGISKKFLPQIGTNPEDVTRMIAETFGYPADKLSPLIAELISATKENRLLSLEVREELQAIANTVVQQEGLESIFGSQEFKNAVVQAREHIEGTLGTFSRGEESVFLQTIETATQTQWTMSRDAFRAVCSGQVECGCSIALEQATPEQRRSIDLMLLTARRQRKLARGTPWVRLHLFIHYLHELVQSQSNSRSDT
jgi:hypothetical protein